MGKIAFVFPGQGVQTPMMGKDFYDNSDDAKDIYRLAGEASGVDVEKLCFTQNYSRNLTALLPIIPFRKDSAAALKFFCGRLILG